MGFALFIAASFICVNATSLEVMVIGRILQGIAFLPQNDEYCHYSICTLYGAYHVLCNCCFILVPVIAPAMGKFILDYYNWHGIFYIQVLISILVSWWFWKRQPETLSVDNKKNFQQKVL
jgi:DHA1 family bicyclomycin/chloramphenicol resistance-like MFS transporter